LPFLGVPTNGKTSSPLQKKITAAPHIREILRMLHTPVVRHRTTTYGYLLMSFFKRMIAFITSIFSTEDDPSSEPMLPKIEPEKIKKKLDLQNEARRNGQSGVPLKDSTQMTAAEHAIRAELGRMREQTVKFGVQRLKQIQNRIDSIDITHQINRAIELGNEFVRRSDQALTREDSRLKDYASEARTKLQILREFRENNRLPAVSASYSSGGHLFLKVMVLIVCCILEGALNAVFFGSGLEGGLLSGFSMAFMLSALNVTLCAVAGFGFRNKNHVEPARRVAGWLCFGFALLVTLGLGALIAYFRYVLMVLEDGSSSPLLLAWESARSGVFPFQDFESLVLFFATVVCGAIAFWKGIGFSDRYPGYARIWLSYAEAHRQHVELIDYLRDELEQGKTDILYKIDNGVGEADKELKLFRYNMNQKSVVRKQVSETLLMADETLMSLTRYYQNENVMARPKDSPPPAYFNQDVHFPSLDMPMFGVEQDEARLSEQVKKLNDLIAQVEPMRAKIQSSFNHQFNQLQPLQELV
jgi:hypothetical protein